MKRLHADPDQHIAFEAYAAWVRNFETEQALLAISRVCRAIELRDPRLKKSILGKKQDVGQWQLAHFAKALIERSNDYRSRKVDDTELYLACNYYNNIREPHPDDPLSETGRREVLNNLIRMSYSQFPFQITTHREDIPRTLILFEELAALAASEFDVARTFYDMTGMSVREFMVHGFFIWAMSENGEVPPVKPSINLRVKELLPEDKQIQFRDLVVADYQKFRECQEKQFIKPGFEKQQFNCLHIFPLIKTKRSGKVVCPVPLLLIRRITSGIYYQLQTAYSAGGVRNDFTTFFGRRLFEPYVGMQLRELKTPTDLLPEQDIGSEKTCDWILVENDAITLIECKSLGLTQRSKSFARTDDVAEDLRKRIVKAVQAFERTREAIAAGIGSLAYLKGNSTRNLIVFYDDIYLFNSLLYRELVDFELKALGLGDVVFQVISVRELEYVIPLLGRDTLAGTLDAKMGDKEHATWDMRTYIDRVLKERGETAVPENALLKSRFDALFDGLQVKWATNIG